MQKTKITFSAEMVVKVPEGDVDVLISEDGIVYLPVMVVANVGTAVSSAPASKAAAPAAKGKTSAKPAPVEEEEPEAPGDVDPKEVEAILAKLEAAQIRMPAAEKQLAAAGLSADQVAELLQLFDTDEETPLTELVANFLGGEAPAAPAAKGKATPAKGKAAAAPAKAKAPAAPAKGKAAAKPKMVEVSQDDLVVGDQVEVFWPSEDGWFKGEVDAIEEDGNILIAYEDETSEYLDETNIVKALR